MSTKAPNPLLVFLNSKKDKLVAAVPRTFQAVLTFESILQGIAIALEDPKTGPALSRCSPESIYSSLITVLRLGLDPSPIRGQAYLIPRGRECTAMIGSRGKIELAYRSGMITKIVTQCIYANDDIEIDLANGEVVHKITKAQLLDDTDPGPAIAAYARVWIKGSNEPLTELLRRRDFEKIKNGSKSPAYVSYEDEMFRKAVLGRALKRCPSSAELMEVLNRDVDISETAIPARVSLHADVIENEPTPAALPDYGTAEEVDAELSRMAEPVHVVEPPKPAPIPTPKPTFDGALPTPDQLRAEIADLEKRIDFKVMSAERERFGFLPLKPIDSRTGEAKLTQYRDALRARVAS